MKNNLLLFVFVATFLKLLLFPQVASAQNNRIWGTYYGGPGNEYGGGCATDAAGNVYLAGSTNSGSFDLAANGFQNTYTGGMGDAFLVKFDASGARIWATYYGGGATDYGHSVAIDIAGNVYLAGSTNSLSGIASGGFQNTFGGGNSDAYLVKFDYNGNRLWATYYGGLGDEWCRGLATDAAGNVYMSGSTNDSSGFIASGGFQNSYGGGNTDAFLVKFDANGNRLWATYYGGTGDEESGSEEGINTNIATDASGDVYMAGYTTSLNNIASGGFQDTSVYQSAFLVKFNANGNRLWGTYYGGVTSSSFGSGTATDASGNVYLTGGVTDGSSNLAYKGFQDTIGNTGGGDDAFLVKFDANGNRIWATFYGGAGNDYGEQVATDVEGSVYMAGITNSFTNIASGGFRGSLYGGGGGGYSMFLAKFDAIGNRLCATYYSIGPEGKVGLSGLATYKASSVYISSNTDQDTGIASGGFQNTIGGGGDSYLIKFTTCPPGSPIANFQSSDSTFCSGDCINYTDLSVNATSWQWSFPGGTPSSSTVQNPQGICYYTPGTFNATLIASNTGGIDTITFINHIHAFVSPTTPVITQHHDSLFCSTDPSYTSYQWYDSTTLIPGATDTFLIVTHGGNYNVAVTNEFGCKISVGITIANDVGINEFSANNSISLYPNPASNQLFIYTSSRITGKAIISIINVLGQEVLSYSLSHGECRGEAVNITTIPPGIYFLQIKTELGIDTQRFVKE